MGIKTAAFDVKKPNEKKQRWVSFGALSTLFLWISALWWALVVSPSDFRQGEGVRFLYLHVPCSWLALGIITVMMGASILFLVGGLVRANLLSEALAPIGGLFAFLSMITGALWGKPIWGTFWVWDARLTSMLILWISYGGIWALRSAFTSPYEAQKPVAFLILITWLNVPIIKGSVTWFRTLHQPASVIKFSGPSLSLDLLIPLMLMTVALGATTFWLVRWRLRLLEMRYKILAIFQRNPSHVSWIRGR
ncbi:MAG: cytochrome c biogenesis protein CcsA [Holosporales bacterium]